MNFLPRRKPSIDEQMHGWLKTKAGCSPNTLRMYEGTIRQWNDSGLSPLDYIHSLIEGGRKLSTVKVYKSALNNFLNWQVQRGYSSENTLTLSADIRQDRPMIQALSTPEVAALLEGCNQLGKDKHRDSNEELGVWPMEVYRKRLGAMVALQVSTGLRSAELLSLTWGDIDLRARTGHVWGKGRKERPFRFGIPARRELIRWAEATGPVEFGGLIFTSSKGTPVDQSTYRKQLKEAGWWGGIGHVHPHMLRHTFAVNAAAAGTPAHDLQQMLGHSSILTTQIYLNERDRDRAWRDLDARSRDVAEL